MSNELYPYVLIYVKCFLLGIIQGITEFLPISSTAHLKVAPYFFGWSDPGVSLSASLQLGSAFAVIYYFDLSGFPAGVLLIQSAMPSAILNYLVGSMYSPKKIVDSIASTIVTSTLMSFITIPIVVFFALRYFN